MQTYTLKIQHENIAEKVLWVLKHFEKDGVIIQKDEEQNSIKSSIKKSVKELNEVKTRIKSILSKYDKPNTTELICDYYKSLLKDKEER
jgi:transcription termination factor NusB